MARPNDPLSVRFEQMAKKLGHDPRYPICAYDVSLVCLLCSELAREIEVGHRGQKTATGGD